MRTVTLQELITSAQRYADMENSSFLTQAEWISYINNAATKYWNLINSRTQDYNLKELFFPMVFNQQDYDLPADFLYVRGVDCNVSANATNANNNWIAVERYVFAERNINQSYVSNFYGYFYLRYRIQGNVLRFEPNPQGYQTVRLSYIPVMPNLIDVTDTIDGINGFDDYIAMIAAARAKAKEESDVTWLMGEIALFEQQVKAAADDRNRDEADRVQDVNNKNRWGYGW